MDEQPFKYFAIVTNKGTAKIAKYLNAGKEIKINFVAVGDGNGKPINPDPAQTALTHEVWRGKAQTTPDLKNPNVIKSTATIPTTEGGWLIREIGLIDQDGDLFAIANAPGYPKTISADGAQNDMRVGMSVAVSNRSVINLVIDGTVIIATIYDIEEHDKTPNAHEGHFNDWNIHVSPDDRTRWDNPLIVKTVLLNAEGWSRDPHGVTFVQDVTDALPPETVKPNMDLSIKADPNLIAQMVDKDIGLVGEQSKGRIIIHALREAPPINMYVQLSLFRAKQDDREVYHSNLLGNPGLIGTPLPLPISKKSIVLTNASTPAQLKITGSHVNPELDFAATRIVRGENTASIGPTDGIQILDGQETTFEDTNNLKAGVKYFYAYFPRNEAGNYQMSATVAEITIPTQKPLAPTNLTATDSTDAGAFAATLTCELPVDVYRDHIAVVRKAGSAPNGLTDGVIVYEGTESTFRDTTATTFDTNYHYCAFAVNSQGELSDPSPVANVTLKPIMPQQISGLTAADASAPEYGYRAMLRYKKAADVNAYKTMLRRKQGETPATSIDGDLVYEDTGELHYDIMPYTSQEVFWRGFAVNQAGQINSDKAGATASLTFSARTPGSITNLQASDTKGTTTGSFDLPTVLHEGKELVNRFVAGYVVIQKEDSVPQTEADGEVIASAEVDPLTVEKTVSFVKEGQKNQANLFITVFIKNHAGNYFRCESEALNIIPKVFPDEPTSYSKIADYSTSGTFTAPEDGWYQLDAVSASGSGGAGGCAHDRNGGPSYAFVQGGPGGTGAVSRKKTIKLKKGETISFTINGTISIPQFNISVTPGGKGGDGGYPKYYYNGTEGTGGSARGGDETFNGVSGDVMTPGSMQALGYQFYGGTGAKAPADDGGKYYYFWGQGSPGSPVQSFIRVYRGNTNILEPVTAQTFAAVQTQQADRAFATEQTVAENKANQDRTNEENTKSMQELQAQQEEAIIDTDYRLLMLEDTQTTM